MQTPHPVRRLAHLAAVAALAILATSCTQTTAASRDLAHARAQWSYSAPASYDFTFQETCFCSVDALRPLVIRVGNGRVTDVRFADTGAAAPADVVARAPTIDSLFARIDRAAAASAESIQAEYEPSLGYPRSAFIDYRASVADDEFGFSVSSFHKL